MKRLIALALRLSALSLLLTVAVAQTSSTKNRLPLYDDADGYEVLTSIIDSRTNQRKTEAVSIFQNTISGESLHDLKTECPYRVPAEFQEAADDFDRKAKTRFRLKEGFSLQKKYRFVAAPTSNSLGVFSVSAVGFNETKTRAVVVVEYLVRPANSLVLGGDTTFYLLRKTAAGWKEATVVPKCGRIY
jgi:hypothetical protein